MQLRPRSGRKKLITAFRKRKSLLVNATPPAPVGRKDLASPKYLQEIDSLPAECTCVSRSVGNMSREPFCSAGAWRMFHPAYASAALQTERERVRSDICSDCLRLPATACDCLRPHTNHSQNLQCLLRAGNR